MKKSSFAALLPGTVSGLLFALGMCMALIPDWNMLRPGAALGCAGAVLGLVSFGAMPPETRRMMNALTGAGVCLFVLLAGVCLILKTGKEDVLWQNPDS